MMDASQALNQNTNLNLNLSSSHPPAHTHGSIQRTDTTTSTSSNPHHRRRLTKKPPSRHQSGSFTGIDARSLGSKRSSTSLRRAPSAPQAWAPVTAPSSSASNASKINTNNTNTYSAKPSASASNSNNGNNSAATASPGEPRFHTTPPSASPSSSASPSTASAFANRSHHNPPQHFHRHQIENDFIASNPHQSQSQQSYSPAHPHPHTDFHPIANTRGARERDWDAQAHSNSAGAPRPLSSKTSAELIGAPFDGTAILNRIEATKSSVNHNQPTPRPAPPPLSLSLSHSTSDTRTMGSSFRQSASFSSTENTLVNEKSSGTKMESSAPSKRHSGDGKESKAPGMLRKKSGFSGFVNSLVGSPKKPLISAPENPVHVTHVGYDSTTGQFTVRCYLTNIFPLTLAPESNLTIGIAQGMATFD